MYACVPGPKADTYIIESGGIFQDPGSKSRLRCARRSRSTVASTMRRPCQNRDDKKSKDIEDTHLEERSFVGRADSAQQESLFHSDQEKAGRKTLINTTLGFVNE
jgi:hypothetical protein